MSQARSVLRIYIRSRLLRRSGSRSFRSLPRRRYLYVDTGTEPVVQHVDVHHGTDRRDGVRHSEPERLRPIPVIEFIDERADRLAVAIELIVDAAPGLPGAGSLRLPGNPRWRPHDTDRWR